MARSLPIVAGLLAGLALGLAIGVRIGGGEPPRPVPAAPPPGDAADDALEALRERLAREEQRRAGLERELARLRAAAAAEAAAEEVAGRTPAAEEEPADAEEAPEAAEVFDAEALRQAGFAESEIQRLRELHDALDLDLLYLRNEARREGWLRSGRFRAEARRLRDALRAEVGDEDYDAMLYAAGRNNRVIVADVLPNSVAAEAGLGAGDVILRYDGERVFDIASLTRATARGRPGELVEMRILRDGREERVFLERGPIGIRLRRARERPDTLR